MIPLLLVGITCLGMLLLYLTSPRQRLLARSASPLWQLPGWTLMVLNLGFWPIALGLIPGVLIYVAVVVLIGGGLALLAGTGRPADGPPHGG